jgi:hypothetical protein
VSSRTARATQRNPVSKNQKNKKTKKKNKKQKTNNNNNKEFYWVINRVQGKGQLKEDL